MKRSFLYGVNTIFAIIIFLGIVIFINLFSAKIYKRFDLTKNKLYTLSDQTKKILKNLKNNLEIIAFYQATSPEKDKCKEILEQYKNSCPKITYKFIDPDRKPTIAKKYNITSYGTIVLKYGEKSEKIYSPEEKEITTAILKLAKENKKKIYFSKGHGEKSFDKDLNILKTNLENEQYKIGEIVLLKEGIPSDCNVVVICGTLIDFTEKEIEILKDYLEKGGRILICLDPGNFPNIQKFLSEYGVESKNSVVIDLASRKFLGDASTPMIINYPYHQITKNFNLASVFSIARVVERGRNIPSGVEVDEIAKTSDASWGETNMKLLEEGKVKFDNRDIKGPLSVAVAVEKKEKEKNKSRMVIFGDSDFLTDKFINFSGNRDFILNSIAWLGEENILISIREKKEESQPLSLSAKQGRILFYGSVIVIPFLILFSGVSVYLRRKYKY